MKKIIILLAFITAPVMGQTMGNEPIPDFWVGTWTTPDGLDTISVTTEKVTWNSIYIDLRPFVSYVDYYLHNDAVLFSFYAYPTVHVISFEKISRNKIIFHAQTHEGLLRCNGIYYRAGTRANRQQAEELPPAPIDIRPRPQYIPEAKRDSIYGSHILFKE